MLGKKNIKSKNNTTNNNNKYFIKTLTTFEVELEINLPSKGAENPSLLTLQRKSFLSTFV